jgi:hypothetical protein
VLNSQWVPLVSSDSFSILTWPSLNRKWVPLVCLDSFSVLTWTSLCAWQEVSAPCALRLFQCSNLTLFLCLTGSECPLCARNPLVSWLNPSSTLDRKWVPLTSSILLVFWLDPPSTLDSWQVPCMLWFFQSPDSPFPLCLIVGGCPLYAQILSVSWLPSLHLTLTESECSLPA